MIKIVITRTDEFTVPETKSFVIQETTNGQKDEYSRPAYDRQYETREVMVTKTVTSEVLSQTIIDSKAFDLAAVIRAINKL